MSYQNKQKCSDLEINEAVDYLSRTPVSFFSEYKDRFKWFKISMVCPDDLNDLKTWWGELNGLKKNDQNEDEKFSLVEVADMITANSLLDREMDNKISEYRELIRDDALEVKITLFQNGSDILIADGNKRAVAMLLEGKEAELSGILITT